MSPSQPHGMFVSVPAQIRYAGVGPFVLPESADVPVPREKALFAAGLLAESGQLSLPVATTGRVLRETTQPRVTGR